MHAMITRKRYPSDLTDTQWEMLAPLIPEPSPNATQETIPTRELSMAFCTFFEQDVRGGTCLTTCPTERPSTTHFVVEVGWNVWRKP